MSEKEKILNIKDQHIGKEKGEANKKIKSVKKENKKKGGSKKGRNKRKKKNV
jgi:hypothetical protein